MSTSTTTSEPNAPEQIKKASAALGALWLIMISSLFEIMISPRIGRPPTNPYATNTGIQIAVFALSSLNGLMMGARSGPLLLSTRRKPAKAGFSPQRGSMAVALIVAVFAAVHMTVFGVAPWTALMPVSLDAATLNCLEAGGGLFCLIGSIYAVNELSQPRGPAASVQAAALSAEIEAGATNEAARALMARDSYIADLGGRRAVFRVPDKSCRIGTLTNIYLGWAACPAGAAIIWWLCSASRPRSSFAEVMIFMSTGMICLWGGPLYATICKCLRVERAYLLEIDLTLRTYRHRSASRRSWRSYRLLDYSRYSPSNVSGSLDTDCDGVAYLKVRNNNNNLRYVVVAAWRDSRRPPAPLSSTYIAEEDAQVVAGLLAAQLGLPALGITAQLDLR